MASAEIAEREWVQDSVPEADTDSEALVVADNVASGDPSDRETVRVPIAEADAADSDRPSVKLRVSVCVPEPVVVPESDSFERLTETVADGLEHVLVASSNAEADAEAKPRVSDEVGEPPLLDSDGDSESVRAALPRVRLWDALSRSLLVVVTVVVKVKVAVAVLLCIGDPDGVRVCAAKSSSEKLITVARRTTKTFGPDRDISRSAYLQKIQYPLPLEEEGPFPLKSI